MKLLEKMHHVVSLRIHPSGVKEKRRCGKGVAGAISRWHNVFSLPEKRTTIILFCKNLPEAEFLCYRKVINVDMDSQ